MKENTGLKPGVKVVANLDVPSPGVIHEGPFEVKGFNGLSYVVLSDKGQHARLVNQAHLEFPDEWEPVPKGYEYRPVTLHVTRCDKGCRHAEWERRKVDRA